MSISLHWHLLFSLLLSWKTKVCFLFVVVHQDSKLDLKFLGLSEALSKWEASLRQKIIFFDFIFSFLLFHVYMVCFLMACEEAQ